MYEDSPEDLVHEHLQKEVWKGHPLGYLISGEKAQVAGFSRERVLEFFRKYYCAENMVISVAGHFDTEQMYEWLCSYFEAIPEGERSDPGKAPVYTPVLWTREKDIEQNHLCLAFNCCTVLSEERYVMTVANNILGGNMNSRLFMKIRDELGLTYSIYSYGSSYEQAGLFQIYAAMQPSQTEQVLEAIFNENKRMICDGVSGDELRIALQQIKAELILGYESSYNRMSGLGKSLLIRDRVVSLEEDLENISRVSREDVRDFFEAYLQREGCGIALVGNRGAI